MGIKTKNILKNIGFLLSVPVIIGAFVFAIAKDNQELIKGIEVNIENPEMGFVTKNDVVQTLMNANVIIDHSSLAHIDVAALELKMNSNPWVDNAEVYVTSNQNIKVRIKQFVPKLRVLRTDSTANSYYLDEKGYMIPLSRKFYPNVPILTSERPITSVEQRKELVNLAQMIEQDTFWQATISQINLDKDNDIELVSLIGDANIRFGSTDDMEDKFFRLFQFYKKGINRINWTNVKELDVRFAKQLVCRRFHKEGQIEETSVEKLYTQSNTKPLASKSVHFENAKLVSASTTPAPAKSTPSKPKSDTVMAVKTSKPKAVKIVEVAKIVESKPIGNNKPAITEDAAPNEEQVVKPEKKINEIIINTDPVTPKKSTK